MHFLFLEILFNVIKFILWALKNSNFVPTLTKFAYFEIKWMWGPNLVDAKCLDKWQNHSHYCKKCAKMGLRLFKVGDTDREPSSDSLSVGSDEYVACPNWLGDSGVRIGSVVGSANFTIVLCSGFPRYGVLQSKAMQRLLGSLN